MKKDTLSLKEAAKKLGGTLYETVDEEVYRGLTYPQGVEKLAVTAGRLQQELDINVHPETLSRDYSTTPEENSTLIEPLQSYQNDIYDLVMFSGKELSEKRMGKKDLLLELIYPSEVDYSEMLRWYEEPDQVDFDQFSESVFESDIRLGVNEKPNPPALDIYWEEIKDLDISDEMKAERMATLDTINTLQGLVHHKDSSFEQNVQTLEDHFGNFKPEDYARLTENDHEYSVMSVFDPSMMKHAAEAVGSCLRHDEFEEAFEMYADDPGSFFHVIARDGTVFGYTRSFLMEDSEDRRFLALDTIEIPHQGGGNLDRQANFFEANSDLVMAGAWGAIETAQDLDAEYVAGKDPRVRYGVRQANGNTSRKIKHSKLGDVVPYYSVVRDKEGGIGPGFGHQMDEFETLDGFEERIPEEQEEVRGFKTFGGPNETEAYILHQNIAQVRSLQDF